MAFAVTPQKNRPTHHRRILRRAAHVRERELPLVPQRPALSVGHFAHGHHDAVNQRPNRAEPAGYPADHELHDRNGRVPRVEPAGTESTEEYLQNEGNNLLFVREW